MARTEIGRRSGKKLKCGAVADDLAARLEDEVFVRFAFISSAARGGDINEAVIALRLVLQLERVPSLPQ